MNTNGELGRKIFNHMLAQIGLFKELIRVQGRAGQRKLGAGRRGRDMGVVSKSCNLYPQAQNGKKLGKCMIKQNSMEKLLKIYKQKQTVQLRDPFNKIHVRRPNSALCSPKQPTQYSKEKEKEKEKENERYEQLKQYYENKYSAREAIKQCKQGELIDKQFYEVGKLNIDGLQRLSTGRRNLYHRKNG